MNSTAGHLHTVKWRYVAAIIISILLHIYLMLTYEHREITAGSSATNNQTLSISFSSTQQVAPKLQPIEQKEHAPLAKTETVITKKTPQVEKINEPLVSATNTQLVEENKQDIASHEQLEAKLDTPLIGDDTKTPVIYDPSYRRSPTPPNYPRRALRRNQQGTVLVRARVTPTGDIAEVVVHQSSGFSLLDQSALAAVNQWTFEPAYRNGLAIEAWVQVPVNFIIR